MVKKLLLALVLTLIAASASAQPADPTITGTIAANDGRVALNLPNGMGTATIQISSICTCTLVVEGRVGTTWVAIADAPALSFNGIYYVTASGMAGISVHATAHTSGTVTVSIRSSSVGGGAGASSFTGDITVGNVGITSFPDNEPINVAQWAGSTTTGGAGAVGAGTPRITHASDDPVTVAVQLLDNAVGTKVPGTAGTGSLISGCIYTSAGVTVTDGQQVALQCNSTGQLITSGSGGGGGTQYTEGDVDATITGTALVFEGAANTLVAAPGTAANGLLVDVSRVSGTVTVAGSLTNISGTVSLPTGASTSANQTTEITALQLIDNPVGSSTGGTAGTSSFLMGGIYNTTPPTLTNGQQASFQFDVNGAVKITGGSAGGTSLADNAAFTLGASLLTPSGLLYEATPTTRTTGRVTIPGGSIKGAARVTLEDSAGTAYVQDTQAVFGGATTWTAGSAPTGGFGFWCRVSSADPATTGIIDDDVVIPHCNNVGAVHTIIDSGGTAGAQYTEGDVDATITGTALVFEGAANTMVAAPGTAANGLLVDVSRVTGSVTVTDGAGALNVIIDSGTVTTVTTVSTVTSLSQLGGVALPIEDENETGGGVGIYAMSVRRDTKASSAGTTGQNATINTDGLGRVWVRNGNPCADTSSVVSWGFTTATSGNVEVVALNGSDLIVVCGYSIVAAAATGIQLIYGTGSACGTGETNLTGVWSFAANGGITQANGGAPQFIIPAGNALCIENSGSNQVDGHFTIVQAPAASL